jgi:hypothetical protein
MKNNNFKSFILNKIVISKINDNQLSFIVGAGHTGPSVCRKCHETDIRLTNCS